MAEVTVTSATKNHIQINCGEARRPPLPGQPEGDVALAVQPFTQFTIYGSQRCLFLLVVHSDVVQGCAIGPIGKHRADGVVLEGDQVKRRLVPAFYRR